ncbi:MAG: VTT domain-containing protein [Candidatus Aenigmarchaeota archaeon]|nr:VTT domain-containing protein [Candidatus Aenigmarchaeota archaeon]
MIDIAGLVHAFGYLGVFLASLIGSASIIFPVPSFALVIAAGSQFDPFWVGIISGAGAAIGELTGYGLGYGIYHLRNKFKKSTKKQKEELKGWKKTFKNWFDNHMGFALIMIFAFTPLPDDVIGIFCGAVKYDIKKFFIAVLIGKIMLGLVLAYGGLLGFELFERLF